MVNCVVLFEVRAEFLSTTYTSFGFKGLMTFNIGSLIKIFRLLN